MPRCRFRVGIAGINFCLPLIALWFVFSATSASAQNVQYTQKSVDLGLRGDSKINPVTHALELQVPLRGYPGRAGTSLPVTLSYSSKVWRVAYGGYVNSPPNPPFTTTAAKFAEHSAAGWTSSLVVPYIDDQSSGYYDEAGRPVSRCQIPHCFFIDRILFHMPDGSTHELRSGDVPYAAGTTSLPDLFVATDGSRIKYQPSTHTLFLPDGSRYVLGTSSTQFIDRNGNTLTYDANAGQWKDTLGRVIGLPVPNHGMGMPAAGDYTYTLPGASGTATYTFRWRNLAGVRTDMQQPLRYVADSNCASGQLATTYTPSLFASDGGNSTYVCGPATFNPVLLHQIVLPDGSAYTLTYNVYGEIDKVVYPWGGYERFQYGSVNVVTPVTSVYGGTNRGVSDRWVSPSGSGADEAHWRYPTTVFTNPPPPQGDESPDGTRTQYLARIGESMNWGYEDVRTGTVYEEGVYAASGQMLRRKLTEWAKDGPTAPCIKETWCYATRNPRVVREVVLLLDTAGNALAATSTYGYDADLNQTITRHYAYVEVDQGTAQTGAITSIPYGALVRTDETVFLVNDLAVEQATRDAYRARNMLALPSVSRVHQGDVTGPLVSETRLRYDETPLQPRGTAQGWTDPGTVVRGNVTTTSHWLDSPAGWVETHAEYDQFGNVWKAVDARDKVSQVEYSAAYQYAYPTHTISAVPDVGGDYGSGVALETFTTYDAQSGLPTSSTDENGRTTSYAYNDPLGRPTRIDRPDLGWTEYYYGRDQYGSYVRTRTRLDDSRYAEGYSYFDGLGRGARTSAWDGAHWATSDTQYDSMGRVRKVSNPYLAGGTADATPQGARWTVTDYDALGRVKAITTPDGAVVSTTYSGSSTTVTDQAGNVRRSVSDALGRLTLVVEAPTDASYNYLTTYTYDALGNLRKVDQGGQQRFFMYDSLGRLRRARNPEQVSNTSLTTAPDPESGNTLWSTAYEYDANGNLSQRTDARGVTATYTYDALNRNTTIMYANDPSSTPAVERHYDGAANGKGRFWYNLTLGTNGSHVAVDEYDAVGRPVVQRQYFPTTADFSGGSYWANQWWSPPFYVRRGYDFAGHVTSQTYPSGRAVAYNYDAAGRPGDYGANLAFSGNLGDGVQRTYASAISYDEAGRMREERFGTATPLYHKLHYNVRGQLYDVRLSTRGAQADEWDWNRGALINYYSQAEISARSNEQRALSGAENNGNLKRAEVYVPLEAAGTYTSSYASGYYTAQQSYAYDALNRLSSFAETDNGGGATLSQVYAYDRWGNRTISSSSGVAAAPPLVADVATNRLYAQNQPSAMQYDYAGNLTYDGYSDPILFVSRSLAYDAENRMTGAQVTRPQTGTSQSQYVYDADGRRVRRKTEGGETWQVYGFDGELLAEYPANAAAVLASKEYGYRGGELLVTAASGDDQRLVKFVHRMYLGALGRGASALEEQSWVATLSQAAAQGQPQLLSVAQNLGSALFDSAEYAGRGRTDGQFVTDLYWTYTQRVADGGGFSSWLSAVQSSGRAAARSAFASSGEFQGLVGRVYGSSTGDDQHATLFVAKMYLALLGRDATQAELDQQVGRINAAADRGQDDVILAARAIGREVSDGSQVASDRDYVATLYMGLVQRAPDSAGWDAWTGTVGTSGRAAVRDAFLNGGEFRYLAASLYREVFWQVPDHLGTPRMLAYKSGSLAGIKRHDYFTFGEEVVAGVGGRTTRQGYSQPDGLRMQFTGRERDAETGLDYFLARYYTSTQGRYTSPDPLLSSGSIYNPQTWNRYAYTINNPLKYTDPFGMYICTGTKDQCKQVESGLKNLEKARDSFKKGSNEYNRLDRSLRAYGAKGVDNGVTINFGATENGGPADTNVSIRLDPANPASKLVTADNPTGQDITVTIDPNQTKSSDDYVLNLGHEGSHVADGSELVGALPTNLTDPAAATVLGGPLNLTKYVTETRAYEVDSFIAQARGASSLAIGKAKHEIWNSGWNQADRATKRAAGIDKVLAEPKKPKGNGLYELTPANQGPKLIQ